MASSDEAGASAAGLEQRVLQLTRELCAELDPHAALAGITPRSSLQRDLGLDSLARAELLLRVERASGVRLPASALAEVDSVHDIVRRLRGAAACAPAGSPSQGLVAARQTLGELPEQVATLTELLDWHAARHGDRTQLIWLGEQGELPLGYGELARGARRIAAWLGEHGIGPGQTVSLMLPTCLEYFHAYFGVLYAGAIPVPIYPPARMQQIGEHLRRHAGILANAQASLLLCTQQVMPAAQLLRALVPGLRMVASVQQCLHDATRDAPAARLEADAQDIAFIQYTSGSTGAPKGVALSHANLLANIRAMGQAVELRGQDVFVSWLPLYHDMGLIAAWLSSLYHGCPLVLMSPLDFLADPASWLWALHRWRGTLTAAPNFAYELCLRHADEARLKGLDLRHVRVMASGSEAVSPRTIEGFAQRFAPYGLPRQALTPVYGLAECTVGLLVPPLDRGPRIDCIDRARFSRERRAVAAAVQDQAALRFVCCGRPLPGHEVRVVDDAGCELGERVEGRLQFRGPSATRGYWRSPELSRTLIGPGGWLDSGDLAYRADGEYYLTGRVKDLIIRGGRHLYPDEIEQAVGELPGVRKGRVVAFGVADRQRGTEALVVVAETHESDEARRASLRAGIAAQLDALLGEAPDVVQLLPPGSVLKTSSGKLRRSATRELYVQGRLGARAATPAWQLARLGLTAAAARIAAGARLVARVAWGARAWSACALLAPLLGAAVLLAGDAASAWQRAHHVARAMLRLAGVPLRIEGSWPAQLASAVVVVNHASYVDALVLLAAIEQPLRLVAKRELRRRRLFARVLSGLGVVFVERTQALRGVEDARRMERLVREGHTLCVFPEGTFRRAPGLLGFHLGAFEVAARAGAPVLPLALRGTREMLPDGVWWPRRRVLTLAVGGPLAAPARAEPFEAAAALLRASRSFVLNAAGEPDAAHVIVAPGSG